MTTKIYGSPFGCSHHPAVQNSLSRFLVQSLPSLPNSFFALGKSVEHVNKEGFLLVACYHPFDLRLYRLVTSLVLLGQELFRFDVEQLGYVAVLVTNSILLC